MVAGRNEPVNIVQVLEVVAGARNQPIEELADTVYANTLRAFPGLSVDKRPSASPANIVTD